MSMAEKVRLDRALAAIERLEARVAELEKSAPKTIEGEILKPRRGRPPKVAA